MAAKIIAFDAPKHSATKEKILDAAETHRIDLIVLATHGRTGVKRLLIGNVAEKVVRHASCPVLTVKPRLASRKSKATSTR